MTAGEKRQRFGCKHARADAAISFHLVNVAARIAQQILEAIAQQSLLQGLALGEVGERLPERVE